MAAKATRSRGQPQTSQGSQGPKRPARKAPRRPKVARPPTAPDTSGQPALPAAQAGTGLPGASLFTVFLDRDGVLDKDKWPGVLSYRMFEWRPGAREALAALNRPDVRTCLVTNQPWTHFLLLSPRRLARLHAHMLDDLRAAGGRLDRIEAAAWPMGRRRKPRPGMLEDAARAFGGVDKSRAILVGDKARDVEAARRFGIPAIRVGPKGDVPDLAAALPIILAAIDGASGAPGGP